MAKYTILFLILFCSSTLASERAIHNNSMFGIDIDDPNTISPLDFNFRFNWPNVGPITYTLPNLTQADKGREWIITESNASTIGLDWDLLSNALLNHWLPLFNSNGEPIRYEPSSSLDTPIGTIPWTGPCCAVSTSFINSNEWWELDYLRLKIGLFQYWPDDNLTYVEIHTFIMANAINTPEPSSSLLVLVFLLLFKPRFYQTPHPLRK